MQRNMDLIRQILLDLEKKGSYTHWLDIDIEEYSPEQMDYHLELLMEAGLIIGRAIERELSQQCPVRLTWEGHEFVDAARDEMRWQKAKESMAKVGGMPFRIVEAVLLGAAKHEMERDLPAIGQACFRPRVCVHGCTSAVMRTSTHG